MIADSSLAVEDSADRLEWACLADPAGYLAWADVLGQLRLTVSADEASTTYGELGDSASEARRRDIEPFETTLDEWVEALSHRDRACGQGGAYPFNISQQGLELRDSPSAAYLFQLLVSLGFKEDHRDGTKVYKLFEELSAMAAGRYLGDSRTAVVFGSPRDDLPAGFREAVAHLANLLREGKTYRDRAELAQSKDDGLDVVAWKEFPRPGSFETDTVWPVRGRPALEKEDTRTPTRTLVQAELRRTDRCGPDSGVLRPKGLVGTGRKRRGDQSDPARPMPYLGAMFGCHGQAIR